MKTATYTNIATKEVYVLGGIKSLEHAWSMAKFVASRNGWNFSMFSEDVRVRVK